MSWHPAERLPGPPRRPGRGPRALLPAAAFLLAAPLLPTIPPHPATAAGQEAGAAQDTVRTGRFDYGKMWTFENAPTAYFTETYGFTAGREWFDQARLAALRIPGCSAAFVSPQGLVATNHHCVRGPVVQVTREGESLLDDGFYAATLEEERPIPGYSVDQLIAALDVSEEVFAAADREGTERERARARAEAIDGIRARLQEEHRGVGGAIRVEVTPLYNGGRYSAYVYRRFTDVRMVAAPELRLGFFGGDPDNFTYPRYALDFAFLRVYGSDGRPLNPEHHFTWSRQGVEEGDVVFVIGNPGPTNRLNTVAQLEYQRDVLVPAQLSFLGGRLGIMREFIQTHPAEAEAIDLRNRAFSLSNSLKASAGRLKALRDPLVMTRKADGERQFREALEGNPELRERYGGVIGELARIQEEKRELAAGYGAFFRLGTPSSESALLLRGFMAASYLGAREMGAPADTLAALRNRIGGVEDHPRELEEAFLEERLRDLQRFLGEDHPLSRQALGGRTVEGAAASLLSRSVLGDATRAAAALSRDALSFSDPGVALAAAILPAYAAFQSRFDALSAREGDLAAELGRARFEVYGTSVPPDASRSPRITDGVVTPYEYNGTLAPVYTTFFGMYDRFHSFGGDPEWALPDRWLPPPRGLDLRTPLNFISTADTYGGNSGSPAVTPGLAIVGLNFDRNIDGLSRDFIYLPERGRNIMVDVRAILAALEHVYGGHRIVEELLSPHLAGAGRTP